MAAPTAAGYAVLNLRTGLDIAGIGVVAGVENVLDKTYRSHIDTAPVFQPGR